MTEHETSQIRQWKGNFGRDYSDRNTPDGAGLDRLYHDNYGISRSELNARFLKEAPPKALDRFPDLTLLREEWLPYLNGSNVDTMFLLEKKSAYLPGARP